MNDVAMFDSLQAFKNFQEAGVAEKHAEVFVEEMNKVVASRNEEIATKGDIAEVNGNVEKLRLEVNGKIDVVEANLRTEIVKSHRELMTRLVIWLGFFATVILAAIGGAVGILLKMLGQ